MDLLEYQAKELFREMGIPVLPSQRIDDPSNLKKLQIPYPVVIKSQVYAVGRGKAGGIRFVENTIDAIAAARTIFNLPIQKEYPEILLAEARYNSKRECFLAVMLDYQRKCPVLLGSMQGGVDLEGLLENLQQVVIEEDFSPFHARHLVIQMGLEGELIQSVSQIVEKIYQLFITKDLDLVEINPLGISATGELMALDGEIRVNDSALGRHPEMSNLTAFLKSQKGVDSDENQPAETTIPQPQRLQYTHSKGNIALLSNDTGLALATWDLLSQKKGKLNSGLIVGEETGGYLAPTDYYLQSLKLALKELMETPEIKVILVNVLGDVVSMETVAEAIASLNREWIAKNSSISEGPRERTGAIARRSSNTRIVTQENSLALPQFVLRLGGGDTETLKQSFQSPPIHWTESMEEAVIKAITLVKSL